jgi:hypothetical protein
VSELLNDIPRLPKRGPPKREGPKNKRAYNRVSQTISQIISAGAIENTETTDLEDCTQRLIINTQLPQSQLHSINEVDHGDNHLETQMDTMMFASQQTIDSAQSLNPRSNASTDQYQSDLFDLLNYTENSLPLPESTGKMA